MTIYIYSNHKIFYKISNSVYAWIGYFDLINNLHYYFYCIIKSFSYNLIENPITGV